MKILLAAMFSLLCIINGCKKDTAETEFKIILGEINNPGFESNSPNSMIWKSSGFNTDAAIFTNGGHTGTKALTHKKEVNYKVTTSQTVSGLKKGIYSLTAFIKNSGGQNACYLFAKNYGDSIRMTALPVSKIWTQIIIRGITISNGECEVGLFSDANGGNSCMIDDVALIQDDISYNFLKGGDISELTYIESKGGKFYENGKEKDCMQILQDNGFNIVRLRLYNDPGNPKYTPSNRLPAGIQNPSDILNLAKRAVAHKMQIELTFHYSDYWSQEYQPHAWKGIGFAALKDSVYSFTYNFVRKMKAQGTVPQFVSLGNEINDGILYPDGQISKSWLNFTELINQGYKAVKDASPASQVILHLSDAGNKGTFDWFFGSCATYKVNYDVIGASYYPFWTKKTATEMRDWADYISAKYNKDIIIMESGYNWTPNLPSGYPGQLSNNGPYQNIYPSSPQGQKNFLLELFSEIKKCKNGHVIGDLYWDPVMIELPGVGWELGAPNVVSNTTLFDFSGKALPALDAFKYNN